MGQASEGEWTDVPPTVAGYFWVKSRRSAQEWIAERTRHGVWDRISGEVAVAAEDGEAAELVQFGRRVPTNAELAQIDCERAALCNLATICMNSRAIMPQFREIEDYCEVEDIIGAFLERLGALSELIQQYGQVREEYGRFNAGDDGAAILEKINAILGVK